MAMTKFLFTTLPTNDLGLLTRSLPVADELARRGHEIAFCSPSPHCIAVILATMAPSSLPVRKIANDRYP